MGYRVPLARTHQITTAGAPQAGALLYVYENATSTLVSLYSDRACGASAANPIVADSAGRFATRYVAARDLLTLTCKTSASVALWSDDDIDPELGAGQGLLADGDSMAGPLKFSSHGNIASAATVDLSTLDGNFAVLTGTTTVTAWGTVQAGARYWLRCAEATPITHHATSAICEGGASFTAAAGDLLELISEGSGNWRIFLDRASGAPLIEGVRPAKVAGWTSEGVSSSPARAPPPAASRPPPPSRGRWCRRAIQSRARHREGPPPSRRPPRSRARPATPP
ncbi:MAG: hypothetical protein ABL883_12175 [Terricaulis sp.]